MIFSSGHRLMKLSERQISVGPIGFSLGPYEKVYKSMYNLHIHFGSRKKLCAVRHFHNCYCVVNNLQIKSQPEI